MKVLVWIAEGTWQTSVSAAALLAGAAEVTLVHVCAPEAETVARGAHVGLLGRQPRRPAGPPLEALSREEAQGLLEAARERLGRDAQLVALRGRLERELIEAARGADVLVVARDGPAATGPGSLGPGARFVLDHAPCPVLLVPGAPGAPGPLPRPGDPPLPSDGR
jgi:nucleotide-binding universal stress UspA family protein